MVSKSVALVALILVMPIFGEWYEINSGTNTLTVETSGIVVASNSLKFSPPASQMWQTTIAYLVDEGKRVQPGEILARFDDTHKRQTLVDHETKLAAAQSELKSLVEEQRQALEAGVLELASAKSAATKAQRKAEQPADLIPSIDYQKLVEQKRLAEYKVAQLTRRDPISAMVRANQKRIFELRVQRLTRMVAALKKDISSLRAIAPSAGVVVIGSNHNSEKLKVGDSVQPSNVVVELVNEDILEVHSEVPEAYSMKLKVGQRARMYAESTGGIEITGKISELGNSVRRKSRHRPEMVRDVHIELDQKPVGLQLGGSVQVVIEIENVPNSLATPKQSIRYQDGLPGVVTRTGWQPVLLGNESDGKFIVLEGIEEGESVQL